MNKKQKRKPLDFVIGYLIFVAILGFVLALPVILASTFNSTDTVTDIYISPPTLYSHTDNITYESIANMCNKLASMDRIEEITPEATPTPTKPYIHLNDEEIRTLATLVYLEGNIESEECQRAICSVVINRMMLWDMTLTEVVYQEVNGAVQFTPAHLIPYYEPTGTQFNIVHDIIENGPSIPEYVCYFRADRYHNWSGMHDYQAIDSTYFSFSDSDYNNYSEGCNNEI